MVDDGPGWSPLFTVCMYLDHTGLGNQTYRDVFYRRSTLELSLYLGFTVRASYLILAISSSNDTDILKLMCPTAAISSAVRDISFITVVPSYAIIPIP